MTDKSQLTFEQQLQVSRVLQALASVVDDTLTAVTGTRVPFSLMTWGGHRTQYVSNAEREDIKSAMRETLDRWTAETDDGPVHKAKS